MKHGDIENLEQSIELLVRDHTKNVRGGTSGAAPTFPDVLWGDRDAGVKQGWCGLVGAACATCGEKLEDESALFARGMGNGHHTLGEEVSAVTLSAKGTFPP